MQDPEDNIIYIQTSKKNIDNFIRTQYFKKAFALLIMVLERLDDNEKKEMIHYYRNQLNYF